MFNPFFANQTTIIINFSFYIRNLWTISNIFCNLHFYPGVRLRPEKSNLKKSLFFKNGGRQGLKERKNISTFNLLELR